jgi:hypothetical protein
VNVDPNEVRRSGETYRRAHHRVEIILCIMVAVAILFTVMGWHI